MSEVCQEKYYDENRGPDLRMKPSHERRHWVVSNMWDIHHEITRLLSLGLSNKRIAEKLGVTHVMVSNVKNSPIVKDKLAIMRGARDAETIDVAHEIQEFAPVALQVLKEVVSGEVEVSTSLKVSTAKDLLSRAGFPPIRRFEGMTAHLNSEDIENIKKRAMENKEQVIDAEFSEE